MDAYHPDWFAMFAFVVRPLKRLGLNAFAVSLSLSTALSPVLAAPIGGQVTAGVGIINQSGPATVINQSSDRLIVEWQSFDTIKGETVTFLQPGSDAWALNRILSGQATQFDGSLFANGNVVITNGSGIHFGKNAFVDVGSLIATTSGISNQNFLSGNLIFDRPGNPDAMVTNAGSISVKDSGLAALVAPGVENSGLIQANLGTVILGAGEAHTIDFYGDGLVKFTITEPTKSTPRRTDGSDADGLVNNSGTVKADGGTVIMTAAQASNVLDNAINMSGIAQANSVSTRNGKIVLGGGSGRVKVTGKVIARSAPVQPLVAPIPATRGGTVHVTGDVIEISSTAEIDASGTNGGGEVLIGGALKGGTLNDDSQIGYVLDGDKVTLVVGENAGAEGLGYVPNAQIVTVEDGATIDVSATDNGDGGTAILWADDTTVFNGSIKARGGAHGGDGGFVETSGARRLGVGDSAQVDALAPNGAVGDWLLDPKTVQIADGGGASLADIADGTDTTSDLIVDADTLNNAAANISIVATDTITFDEAVAIINAGVGLSARAGDEITVNQSITTNNGNVNLTANDMDIAADINAGTGNVTLDVATIGREIDLGSETAGKLSLTDAELDRISANALRIGSRTAGDITISDAISPAQVDTLSLITAGAILDRNATGDDVTVANLALQVVGGIAINDFLETAVSRLAIKLAGEGVAISNTGALTIGSVDGMSGLTSDGPVDIVTASPLTFATDVIANGNITATAGESGTPDTDNITVNAGVTVASLFGDVTLQAGDDVVLGNNATVSANGTLTVTAGHNDTDSDGGLSFGGGTLVGSTANLTAINDINLGMVSAVGGTVDITSINGAITDGNDSVGILPNIAAQSLSLSAHTGIGGTGTAATLETLVSNLEAQTDTGGIFLSNFGDLTIGGVPGALSGVRVVTAGDIELTNQGRIDINVASERIVGPDAVTVIANGATADILTGSNTIAPNATVQSSGGTVTLRAERDLLLGDIAGAGTLGNVFGGGSVVLDAGRDITVDTGTFIQASGTGTIMANAGRNISVIDTSGPFNGAEIRTEGGDITLTTGADGVFTASNGLSPAVQTTLPGGNGNITINADAMDIQNSILAGTGIVTLQTVTNGQLIDLGGADAAGTLGLTDAELDLISAGVLRIGSTDAGSIDVTAAISPANAATLSLITGDAITDNNAAGADITVANLAMQAVNGIGSADAIDTGVGTVAASNSTSGSIGLLQLIGLGDLTVGTVDGVVGVNNQATTGLNQTRVQTEASNLIINSAVTSALDSLLLGTGGNNLLDNNAAISTGGGFGMDLQSASMALEGGTVTAGSNGRVRISPIFVGQEIDLGSTSDAGAALELSDAELDTITAGVLQIGRPGIGDITITDEISPANVGTLALQTPGAVLDGNIGTDITVDNLVFRTGTGFGTAGNAVGINVDNLAFANTGGVINLSNRGSMAIASVDGLVSSANTGTTTEIVVFGNDTLTFAANTASIGDATFSAPTISVNNSVNVDVTAGALAFNGTTVHLDGNLTASTGITGMANTVNVVGSTGGAEIQDGVDVAAAGATVNVGDGSFDGGITIDKALTLLGDGYSNTTVVNVADNTAGMTVVASDVTIDGFRFEGDGTPANATGVAVNSSAGGVTNVLVGDSTDADLLGNRFTGLTTGLSATDGGTGNVTGVEIGMGNVFDNNTTGMAFSGAAIDIIGDTFSNTAFAAISGNYVELADGAEFAPGNPTIIDGTGTTVEGVSVANATVADFIFLESKLVHYLDNGSTGLIDYGALAVPDGQSIQLAVNAAGLLGGPQTVAVGAGTFGGSVEVWVDDLTLQGLGDTTIIDTDQVDAFANDGDVDNGFGVYEIATGGADPTGTGNVSGVTIDGFRFIGAAQNNDGIVMGVNPVPVASRAIDTTISNVSFEGLLSAVYAEAISGNTLLDNLTGTNLDLGVDVTSALRGGSTFTLQGSNLASVDDTLRFDGNIAGAGTRVTVSSSVLDSSDEEAIDINGVIANGAVVTIGGAGMGNSLTGGDDAIETDNIRGGVLNIANNTSIRGDNGAGIHIDGVIRAGSNVNIVGNDNISGGEDGLFFEGPVRDSTINIAGNTLIEGENRDGIIFYETVRRSNVTVGEATVDVGAGPVDFDANGSIVGGIHGIDVWRVVDSNTANGFKVSGNSFIAGGEDGIIFGNINNSTVEVIDNDAVTGLFGSGIQFAGNVVNGSNVTVDNNDIVAGLGTGIFIGDLFNIGGTRVSDSNISITRNGEEGTPFTGIGGLLGGIMSTSRIIDGSTIAITDNEAIAGGLFGVNLVEDIADSEVHIANNGVIFGGLIAGIHVGSFLNPGSNNMDNSTLTIEDNDLITSFFGDGVASTMAIENASTINILENIEISGDVDGIYFEEEITDSFVNINGNTDIIGRNGQGILFDNFVISSDVAIGNAASGNGRIIGGDNGIALAPVLGGSLRIVNNTEIRGENVDGISLIGGQDTTIEISDNDQILGDGFDGIYVEDTLVTSDFTVANNRQITGADDGMNIGFVIGGSVNITDNSQIRGVAGSGIEFDALVNNGATLNVTGNSEIRGGEEGVEFDGDVENSIVAIADNASIVGETTDGILFNDVSGSEVVVSNNVAMGGVNGFSIENNSGAPSTSKFVFDRTTLTGGTGAGLSVVNGSGVPMMEIDLSSLGGNVFTGAPSMFLSGSGLSLAGDTLGTTFFNSIAGSNFIELANAGLFEPGRPTIINGDSAIFDGASVTIGGISIAATIEARIIDFDDNNALGQIFFRDPTTNKSAAAIPTNIRVTNIQAPGDHILRPTDILNILPEGVFGEDYKLGECSVTPDEDTGLLQVQCIVRPGGDISPFVVAFLATLSFGDVATLN